MTDAALGHRPALVLDADLRQSLVTARSLGRAGVGVHLAESRDSPPAFVSRWATGHTVLPDVGDDADAFVAAVCELCEELGRPVLIASHDGSIEALRAQRDRVESVATLALASERALAVAVDKRATLSTAARLGLDVPEGASAQDLPAVESALEQLGLPVVVKPARSWVDDAAGAWRAAPILARTRAEALGFSTALIDGGAGVLLQRWLPGAREAVSILIAEGEVRASFAQQADRVYPLLGGADVLRRSIAMPEDTGPMAVALLREIELEGFAQVEFRRDAGGRPFLMEINSRLSASIETAVRAGIDFPLMLYRWAAGEPVEGAGPYRSGLRMRYLGGDVGWLKEALRDPGHPDAPSRTKALARFISDFARPTGYDYWDSADPVPAALVAFRVVRGLPGRLLRAVFRQRAFRTPSRGSA